MQVAIDNAKRRFDIDLANEIARIKSDMNVQKNKYPNFWKLIRRDLKPHKFNPELHCPMNELYDLDLNKFRNNTSTLPMEYFFKKFPLEKNRKTCKKVEELISKYSLNVFNYNTSDEKSLDKDDDYLLLRRDFDDLIKDIRSVYISNNYLGLMSWLVDRAFLITPNINSNEKIIKTRINMNKSILLKILYEINSTNLLKVFSNHC